MGQSSAKITPLWIVAAFVTLTEAVLGIALTQVDGGVQIALTVFVIVFALLVAGAFFVILWNRPYVFYPPSEYGDKDPKQFMDAIRSQTPDRVVDQIDLVEMGGDDELTRFAVIDSLIDDPFRQIIILMYEEDIRLPYNDFYHNYQYETGRKEGSWSKGGFSPKEFARKLDGTDLLEIRTRGPFISLTNSGRRFAEYLLANQRKADFLVSSFGGWGERFVPAGFSIDSDLATDNSIEPMETASEDSSDTSAAQAKLDEN